MGIIDTLNAPTPVKARRWGNAIIYFAMSLTAIVQTLPITPESLKWVTAGIAVVGLLGKTLSNMWVEQDESGS